VFYSRSLDGGASFSDPYAIATNGGGETNSLARICASSSDKVFVFWQDDGESSHRAMYRRSLDGGQTFDAARRVRDETNPLTSTMKLAVLSDAQVGPDGAVYVMGLDEQGGVAFLKSLNDGQSFKLVGYLPEPAARGNLCPKSFVVGPGGVIHALVGVCGTALYYTRLGRRGSDLGHGGERHEREGAGGGRAAWSEDHSSMGPAPGHRLVLPVGGSTEIFSRDC
jgi:hypothetical protein